MKLCTKCGDKPARESGNTWCKPCNTAYARAWRKANPEKWAEQRAKSNARSRARYASDPLYKAHVDARNLAAQDKHREASAIRRRLYGIPRSTFQNMLRNQSERCAVCANPLEQGRRTHVDHDHTTGFVRGLLCAGCNTGLGCFADNPEKLLAAAEYLLRFQPPVVVSLSSLDAC